MISISEVRACILQSVRANRPTRVPLAKAVGHVLAEDILSDVDSPPQDKSLVDGFAISRDDAHVAHVAHVADRELQVIERVVAGQLPRQAVRPGVAVQIMTGAPVPPDTYAVVMVEQAREIRAGWIQVDAQPVQAEQHVMRQGAVMRRGTRVLEAGHRVRAVDVGLLAEVGCAELPVIASARVAVLATGNELVSASERPGPAMIRNSNGPLLSALATRQGADVVDLGIAPDQPLALQQAMRRGLDHDVLILSGGVSAGVLDLVPAMLETLGVECVFHKVHLKPGKPLWFGRYRQGERSCCVFGLPGNPVSSLVCFELFVAPALRQIAGRDPVPMEPMEARLTQPYQHRSDRPTYHPARLERCPDHSLTVTLIAWQGSADQRAIAQANGLALLPATTCQLQPGDLVPVVPFGGEEDAGL